MGKNIKLNENKEETKAMNTNNKNNKEGKKMETWLKVLLTVCGVACVGTFTYGALTYQTAKENEIKDAATKVELQTEESTQQKTEIEEQVDMNLKYEEEAKALWNKHKELFICEESTFIEKYVSYRLNDKLTSKQSYDSLYNEYAKENQVATTINGEVVAQASEMDIEIEKEQEQEATEKVEKADFEVVELEAEEMYAIKGVNKRKGPDAKDFDKVGSLKYGDKVKVTGIVNEYKGKSVVWYQLDTGEFACAGYFAKELPKQEPQPQPETEQQTQPEQYQTWNKFIELNEEEQLEFLKQHFGEDGVCAGSEMSLDTSIDPNYAANYGYEGNVTLE